MPLLLFCASGLAALSWELLWQIYAGFAVGVSAQSVALTVAVMMAGMTAGAMLGGRLLGGHRRPLLVLAAIEAGVGALGLLLPLGFAAIARVDAVVYAHAPRLAVIWQIAGVALVLGPAAIGMGATVPLMRRVADASRTRLPALYAANAFGAVVGVLLQTLVLLPALGLRGAGGVTAALNFAIALGALRTGPLAAGAAEHEPAVSALPWMRTLALTTGFVTFVWEVAWFRSFKAAFQSTTDSFALMLLGFLLPIAIGAAITRPLRSLIPLALVGAGAVAALAAGPLVDRVDLFTASAHGYWALFGERAAIAMVCLGPPVLLVSLVLPALLAASPEPAAVGRLYALNTLGCVTGSIATAWIFLPSIGAYRTIALAAGLLVVVGALVTRGWRRWAVVAAAPIIVLIALQLDSGVGRMRVQAEQMTLRPLASREAADATVSVAVDESGHRHLIIDGFQTAGEAAEGHYMAWMGHLPMLAHPDPKRALVICFGTGQTSNAVRREHVQRLDIVELSPAVLALAPLFESNQRVLDDPRVHVHETDGRAFLRRSRERFDVITLEPMEPHFAGTNDLYSIDFYRATAAHMDEHGVLAQWVPLHLLPPREAASVVRTFVEVFPNAALWIDPHDHTGILIGQRAASPPIAQQVRPGSADLTAEQVLEGFVLAGAALRDYAGAGEIISDDNQLLAYGTERRTLWRLGSTARNHELNLSILRQVATAPR